MVNPTASDVDEFTLQMQARDGAVNGKHMLATLRSPVAQGPHRTVLCPHQEVERTLSHERDGANASGLELSLIHI